MVYAQTYKECEATSTGAMRKSTLATGMVDGSKSPPSPAEDASNEADSPKINSLRIVLRTTNGRKHTTQWPPPTEAPKYHCISCGVHSSPIWWSVRDKDLKHQKTADDDSHGMESDIKMENGGDASLDWEAGEDDQKLCHRCYFVS